MGLSILQAFENVNPTFEMTPSLAKRIHTFQVKFKTESPEHIAFFGDTLIGTQPMRFKQSHRDEWFDQLLNVDEIALEDEIKKIDDIDPNWKRGSDAFNLSIVWALHQTYQSKLTPKEKHTALVDITLIFQYKLLGSILAHYFQHNADEATVLATYARLSRKYIVKTEDSWSTILTKRAIEIISPGSIHYKTISKLPSSKDAVYMISDIQGRIRELIKAIVAVFYKVRDEGHKITSVNDIATINDEVMVKDKSNQYATLIRYATTTIQDRSSWVKDELVNIICDAIKTVPPKQFTKVLEWVSLNRDSKYQTQIEALVTEVLLHAFAMISKDRQLYGKNSGLTPLVSKLKNVYLAARISDPALLSNRALSEELVRAATNQKNSSVISGLRTGLQMYIVLRTLAMKHYQN